MCDGRGGFADSECLRDTDGERTREVFYLLDRPVHRGEHARAKPLRYLGRVSEYFRATLGADCGYTGVLSSNPVHDDYQTSYPRTEPYTLDQLAGAIPKGWRVPHVPTTGEGKNCSLFAALCKLALGGSDEGLLTWARSLNREFDPPLPDAEVRGVWRSVCRYRARWRVQGHQRSFLFRQSARGRKSGVVRLASVADRDRFIVARLDAGESQRAVARAFGVALFTVQGARARLSRRSDQRTNTGSAL